MQTKADIEKRLTGADTKPAEIKSLVAEGKSLDDIKKEVGDQPAPGRGGRGPAFASFTEVVYRELTKGAYTRRTKTHNRVRHSSARHRAEKDI